MVELILPKKGAGPPPPVLSAAKAARTRAARTSVIPIVTGQASAIRTGAEPTATAAAPHAVTTQIETIEAGARRETANEDRRRPTQGAATRCPEG